MPACTVCGAPPLARSCVFCHTPHRAYSAPTVVGLLDYLGRHLPRARVRRGGILGRGQVQRFQLQAGGESFAARFRKGELVLAPALPPPAWTERLLVALSREAAASPRHRRRSAVQAGHSASSSSSSASTGLGSLTKGLRPDLGAQVPATMPSTSMVGSHCRLARW